MIDHRLLFDCFIDQGAIAISAALLRAWPRYGPVVAHVLLFLERLLLKVSTNDAQPRRLSLTQLREDGLFDGLAQVLIHQGGPAGDRSLCTLIMSILNHTSAFRINDDENLMLVNSPIMEIAQAPRGDDAILALRTCHGLDIPNY